MKEDAGCQAKLKRTFPRSDAARQRRIQSNNHKVPRFQNHSRELNSHSRIRQGADNMSHYAGQDVQNMHLPPSIPPRGGRHLSQRCSWEDF